MVTVEVLSANHGLSLGFQARVRRVARLLTQRELAELAGVSPKDVGTLESGRLPSPDIAEKLLRQLGISHS